METYKYKGYDVYLEWAKYHNGNIALSLVEDVTGEVVAVATVNLEGVEYPDAVIGVKNYNENEGMEEFLQSIEIIDTKPLTTIKSGYVEINYFQLTIKAMQLKYEQEEGC